MDDEDVTGQSDLGALFVNLGGGDVGERAVAAVDDALVNGAHDFGEGHGLAVDAAFLGEVDVQGDVRHAHTQVLDVVNAVDGLLGVEVAEAQREHVEGAQAGLFGKSVGEEVEDAAVDGLVGVLIAVVEHGSFHHGHGGMERGNLSAGGAHFNGAATGVGDILVFLSERAVGVHLDLVLAVGKLFKIFAELVHADSPSAFMPAILMTLAAWAVPTMAVAPIIRPMIRERATKRFISPPQNLFGYAALAYCVAPPT